MFIFDSVFKQFFVVSQFRKKSSKKNYKTISFKLTAKQQSSLQNYCVARKTTPTKLIKKFIRPYLERYIIEVPEEYYISENQLNLFEESCFDPLCKTSLS